MKNVCAIKTKHTNKFQVLISDLKSAWKTDLRNTLFPEVALILKILNMKALMWQGGCILSLITTGLKYNVKYDIN